MLVFALTTAVFFLQLRLILSPPCITLLKTRKMINHTSNSKTANLTTVLLGFAAFSNTGKTTLLTKLIPELKQAGLKVAVIKHSHHDFEVDQPGKDSYRLRKAGATPVMLVSPFRRMVITEFPEPDEISLGDQLSMFADNNLDLILVEGFRHEAFPKIELHRPDLGKPLLYPSDSNIIAIASDQPLITPASLPCLDLNDTDSIAQFILHRFFQSKLETGKNS